MYHQIDEPPTRGTALRGLIVAPSSFAWQMRFLRLTGYRGLSMQDLLPYLRGEKTGKVVGITFDDGYQNNLIHALPILKKNRFTATCYGVSDMIGGTNVWDTGLVAEKPLMTLTDWRAWYAEGMDVGSHTRTHAKLTTLPPEQARDEIARSKAILEEAVDCPVNHFCYPYGWFGTEHEVMVKQAGYETATSTRRGRVYARDDLYTLRRIMVARATNPMQFAAKIMTRYEDRKR